MPLYKYNRSIDIEKILILRGPHIHSIDIGLRIVQN